MMCVWVLCLCVVTIQMQKKKKKTSNNIFNSMIVLHTIHIYSYILQEAIENSNEMKSNQNVDSLDKQQAK